MKMRKNFTFKNDVLLKSERLIITAVCVFLSSALIAYPNDAIRSISSAIRLCADTVIPSLFPFLFLSSFLTSSGILSGKSKFISHFCNKFFSVPYEAVIVFIMSAIGGFPVGAKMASSLLEKGNISENTAKRLVFSCVNPSVSFAISAVGLSLFSSTETGVIIYSSVVISNLILFVLSRFIIGKDEFFAAKEQEEKLSISSAFVSAGNSASEAMISICCYVLLFSCLCEIMKNFVPDETILGALCAVCEVTTGCRRLSFLNNVPLIAGAIGWGGISVHFQIMDAIRKSGLEMKLFFFSRAVSAFLSVLICSGLLYIFPSAVPVIKMSEGINVSPNEKSITVSVMMLLTCFVFLISDYSSGKRKVES